MVPHLYIHVPFCPNICPYCDFHVLRREGDLVERYLAQLEHEIIEKSEFIGQIETFYLGGGTPSFLRDRELAKIIEIVRENFDLSNLKEATIEVNPGTISKKRAIFWKNLGFNRASLGIQSTDDKILKFLGRTHSSKQAYEAIDILHELQFRVSGDLITAIDGQNTRQDLINLARTGLKHISAYTLTIENGTIFAKNKIKVDPEKEEDDFYLVDQILSEFGLERYEVSNHAIAGEESLHNIAYWENRFYLGIGPSATGHYPINRLKHGGKNKDFVSFRQKNPDLYDWLNGKHGEVEFIDADEFFTDSLFAGLRLKRGLDLKELSQKIGFDPLIRFHETFHKLQQTDFLQISKEFVETTQKGTLFLNQIVMEFIEMTKKTKI